MPVNPRTHNCVCVGALSVCGCEQTVDIADVWAVGQGAGLLGTYVRTFTTLQRLPSHMHRGSFMMRANWRLGPVA
eukprot:13383-Eustigmatos_ZCMA.PRE.1